MISVCMATYNGERFIESQLNSILKQLDYNDEIIISDGGSSDKTIDIINFFNDRRIKLLKNTSNKYSKNSYFKKVNDISSNFENALKYANGDVIFLSDQDDVWHDNKVKQMNILLKECDCVVHDCRVVSNEEILEESLLNFFKPNKSKWGMFYKTPFMGCCMGFRKTLLPKILPFPKYNIEHDTWIGMCAFKNGKVLFSDEILMDYRRHTQNASPVRGKNTNSMYFKFLRRLNMLLAYLTIKK